MSLHSLWIVTWEHPAEVNVQHPSKEALHVNQGTCPGSFLHACLYLCLKKNVKLNSNTYTDKCLNPECTAR